MSIDTRAGHVREFDPGRLESLTELIGDARVVAIGENNHHVPEFGALRGTLVRHLVRELGCTVLGVESGFAEGALVRRWTTGGPGTVAEVARDGFTFSLGESAEMHELLTWLREHNREHADAVTLAGLDLPSSAGSPESALAAVREYLDATDPSALSLVDEALAATAPYSAVSNALAPARYAALDEPARAAATSALTRLLAHLDALAPAYRLASGEDAFVTARHHALGAIRLEAHLREVGVMLSGDAPELIGSSRDTYLAETVRLLLERHGGDGRIVLLLHNGHLQRVPMRPMARTRMVTAGQYLADLLGRDYFALALTAGTGSTTGLRPDPEARLGFTVHPEQLGPPAEGSVESLLAGHGPTLLDLRAARSAGAGMGTSIRHVTMNPAVEVAEAFDALVYLPEMSAGGALVQR